MLVMDRVMVGIRDGSISVFQNRYDIDIISLKISAIPIYRRYFTISRFTKLPSLRMS